MKGNRILAIFSQGFTDMRLRDFPNCLARDLRLECHWGGAHEYRTAQRNSSRSRASREPRASTQSRQPARGASGEPARAALGRCRAVPHAPQRRRDLSEERQPSGSGRHEPVGGRRQDHDGHQPRGLARAVDGRARAAGGRGSATALVARQVGLDGSRHSLVDALVGPGLTLEDMVEQLPQFNLSVLQAGEATGTTYELLKSSRLKELVDEARRRYDYNVLDTPPFVPVPDGRLITKCADGVLVVLAANRTPRGALAEALSLIDPAKIVGLVFNGDDSPTSSSYYGGYVASPPPDLGGVTCGGRRDGATDSFDEVRRPVTLLRVQAEPRAASRPDRESDRR